MNRFKRILRDYEILDKRFEIDYRVRKQGGNQINVSNAWESQGVGYIERVGEPCSDLDAISAVMVSLRHPIKAVYSMLGYYMERREEQNELWPQKRL